MPAVICLLRGVNVGGNNILKMDALRSLCESLKLRDVQTYVQSGNIVFRAPDKDLAMLGARIETAIEKAFGFRPDVVLRTLDEMRDVAARNPFAGRREEIEPGKLIVVFMGRDPGAGKMRALKTVNEEVHHLGRELFIYFPDGMGKSKLSFAPFERGVDKVTYTSRNWNTVTKLIEMAASLEA